MKKVAFHTLGCKVNSYETQAMQQLMEKAGYIVVDFSGQADIYIINTCSVTNIADRKSRQMLHKAKKENPEAIVVAAGCYVQAAGENIKADESVDIIVGNNMKQNIVEIIEEYKKKNQSVYMLDISKELEYEKLNITSIDNHTRAFVKIQDGCNQFCSYCIIPYTRGRVRSRLPEDIIEEVEKLAKKGFKEIVLTGIHLASYGADFRDDMQFNCLIDLIKAVSLVKGIYRIRLGSLEPRIIDDNFLMELVNNDKFCPHFHLSLQSGCDDTLQRMNRHYSCDEYYNGVQLIRKYFPNAAITTDIIVGFPGENLQEFNATYEFVKKINFYETHIFPYSIRKGTKAAGMSNQLTNKEKTLRAKILSELNELNMHEFIEQRIGSIEEVLTEDIMDYEGHDYITGYTKDYIKVAVPAHLCSKNELISGRISHFLTKNIVIIDKIV